jgi:hypothetical protein
LISVLRRVFSGSASTLATLATAVAFAIVLTLAAAYVFSVPGAPQSPSHGAFVDQAHTSLDEVASDVATVQLLLRLVDEDKVLTRYQRIVALDSENDAGKVASHLSGEQPKASDRDIYDAVTKVLSDASDLLSSTRIAIVRQDTAQYDQLEHSLTQLQTQITKAEGQVPS